jgi:hypothetical protein
VTPLRAWRHGLFRYRGTLDFGGLVSHPRRTTGCGQSCQPLAIRPLRDQNRRIGPGKPHRQVDLMRRFAIIWPERVTHPKPFGVI